MKQEQRLAAREQVYGAGELRFKHHSQPVNRLVRDCSDLGALIKVGVAESIPDTFRLVAPEVALDRSCTVIRRTQDTLGVRFSD